MIEKSPPVIGLFALTASSAMLFGCTKNDVPPTPTKSDPQMASAPATPKTETETYVAEMKAPPTCKAGETCNVELTLVPKSGYHTNAQYPYKFKLVDPAPTGVTYQKPIYARADGAFEEKKGSFKLGFTAAKAGKAMVKGTFFMSVCSEANCIMDKPELEIAVDVN